MTGVPDYPLGETLDFKFTTRQFSDGVPTQLLGTPVIEVYEDNSLVQIVVGETLTTNFDGRAGLNNLRIVATTGNGYEVGKSYAAVITVGTVGGVSVVGEVIAQFSIERSPALRPTTAGRTLDVEATGEAGINLDNALGTLDAAQFGANFLTAAKVNASALDGKGDWNIGKTGYSVAVNGIGSGAIAAAELTNIENEIWDALKSAHVVADSFGDFLDIEVSGRQPSGNVTVGTLTAGALTTIEDEIWDALKSAHVVANSFGDFLDIEVSSRNTGAVAVSSLNASVIDAASIAANAMNGKGDWNIGKTGYSLTQAFPTNFAALSIDAGGLVDILQSAADKVFGASGATLPELPATTLPPITPTPREFSMLLYMAMRNKLDVSTSKKIVHNAAEAQVATKALTDTGGYSEAEMIAGV